MSSPESRHRRAIASAFRASDYLEKLFGWMGTVSGHPRGRVLVSYRHAHRSLAKALETWRGPRSLGVVRETLQEVEFTLRGHARALLDRGLTHGLEYGADQLAIYSLAAQPGDVRLLLDELVESWMQTFYTQRQGITMMLLAGTAPEEILGDEDHAGYFTPAPFLREGSRWLTLAVMLGFAHLVEPVAPDHLYRKQAIAAVDHKTTECCLRVTGQVKPLREKFETVGSPAWADKQLWPPFHWYCRTTVALVQTSMAEDDLTREMIEAGDAELKARDLTGRRDRIWPSHARSGRGKGA